MNKDEVKSGNLKLLGDKALLMVSAQALMQANKTKSKLALFSFVLNIVFALVIVVLTSQAAEVKIKSYGLTPDGRAIELKEIEGEIFSPIRVSEWAGKKAKQMHTFTFRTLKNGEHAASLIEYMHETARDVFLKSIRRDGLEADVLEKNAVVYSEFYKDKVPLWISSYTSAKGTRMHIIQVELIVTIDGRSTTGNERNRQVVIPMEMHVGEVGLGKAKDGLLIGSIKRVASK